VNPDKPLIAYTGADTRQKTQHAIPAENLGPVIGAVYHSDIAMAPLPEIFRGLSPRGHFVYHDARKTRNRGIRHPTKQRESPRLKFIEKVGIVLLAPFEHRSDDNAINISLSQVKKDRSFLRDIIQ
jgi:hypothetical protein